MFLFGLYTVFVWWLAFGWRRRLVGFFAVAVSVFGLLPVKALIKLIPDPDGRPFPLVDVLLYPYMGLLLLGGLYILVLPRPKRPLSCRACAYDMAGHAPEARCPECGTESASVPPRARRAPHPSTRPIGRSAPGHAVHHAQGQDPQRQAGQQHPPEPAPG